MALLAHGLSLGKRVDKPHYQILILHNNNIYVLVVETRMVGSELNIFSNNHWRIYTQAYGDILESPHGPF